MCIVLNKDNTHFYKKIKFIKLCIVLNQDNTHLIFFVKMCIVLKQDNTHLMKKYVKYSKCVLS